MVPFSLFKQGELEMLITDLNNFQSTKSADYNDKKRLPKTQTEGLPFIKVAVDDVSEDDFQSLWKLGQPLVLTNCLERFKMPWTPTHFIENYGKHKCMLFNCKTDKSITSTVGSFFESFLSIEDKRPLKLKVPLTSHS
jgi:hypothetical protein